MRRREMMRLAATGALLASAGAVGAAQTGGTAAAARPRRTIRVGGITLGDGAPKTIVSIAAADRTVALARAAALAANPAVDLVELRIDHLAETAPDAVATLAATIRGALGTTPLIATFRSKREGGRAELDDARYADLYTAVLGAKGADLIDIELARLGAMPVAAAFRRAKDAATPIIVSSHDFDRTPPTAEMIATLRQMQARGGDIPKIAVMPREPGDTLRLLEASWRFVRDEATGPVITMAMGKIGAISRIAGETFGSAATFGADGAASAPGQIPVATLRSILDTLAR